MDREDFRLEDILKIARSGEMVDIDLSESRLFCIFDADLTKEVFPIFTHFKTEGIELIPLAVHPDQRLFNGREYNGWAIKNLVLNNNVTHLMVWWSKCWIQVYMEWLKATAKAYNLPIYCIVDSELDVPESDEQWSCIFKKGAFVNG